MVGTYIFGFWLYFLNFEFYFSQPWMWLKLIAVGLLTIYHFECQNLLSKQKNGIFKLSSFKLRLFNELATVLLVAIVFLVVVKSKDGLLWGILGLFAFAGCLLLAVNLYKKNRKKETNSEQTEVEG
jgi:putative membrane protein